MALPEKPFSRKEQYLAKIAGEDTEIPEKPFSREEMYLEAIANGGGGGGGGDGGIKTLSSSDYDWPLNNPDGVALFRLPVGFYIIPAGLNYYYTSNQAVDRDYKVGGLVEVCYYQRFEELPDDPFVVYEVHDAAGKREGQVYYTGSGTLFSFMVQ